MRINVKLVIAICVISEIVFCSTLQAAMVQSIKQATSYDMFLPKNRKMISNTGDKKIDPSINYNPAIARKLFNMSDGQKRTITIEEGVSRTHAALGSKVRIVLDNIENAQWYMDCSKELVLINTKNENNQIIMLFDTLAKGRASIYLDCVDNSDNTFKVIDSRYINIVVD
ncbi:MAG: hypothetical protein IJX20_03640 [Alphaproteobacteria bacterium]|nr:hypothetical protein [Alphaproteobacteria bacterium]